jgi:hypothetical protein
MGDLGQQYATLARWDEAGPLLEMFTRSSVAARNPARIFPPKREAG